MTVNCAPLVQGASFHRVRRVGRESLSSSLSSSLAALPREIKTRMRTTIQDAHDFQMRPRAPEFPVDAPPSAASMRARLVGCVTLETEYELWLLKLQSMASAASAGWC